MVQAVITSWPSLDRAPLLATVFGALHTLPPQLPLGGGPPPLGDPIAIRNELSTAGLIDVAVEEVTVTHAFPSMHDAWTSIARSTAPLALLRHTLGTDASRDLEAKILAQLLARFGSGPVHFDAVSYLSRGRRAH